MDNREKLETFLSSVLDSAMDGDKVYLDVVPAIRNLYQLHVDERKYDLEEKQIALRTKELDMQADSARENLALEATKLDVQAISEKEERETKIKVAKMEVLGEVVTDALKTVGTGILFGAGLGASFMFERTYGKSISRTFQFFARLIPWK